MDYKQFRCACCHKLHRQRVENQRYCKTPQCQRERKNRWHKEKYATDLDYKKTAQESTRAWLAAQGGAAAYYRNYRNRLKEKKAQTETDKNQADLLPTKSKDARAKQKEPFANSDAKLLQTLVKPGKYYLVPKSANRDSIILEVLAITKDLDGLQIRT